MNWMLYREIENNVEAWSTHGYGNFPHSCACVSLGENASHVRKPETPARMGVVSELDYAYHCGRLSWIPTALFDPVFWLFLDAATSALTLC